MRGENGFFWGQRQCDFKSRKQIATDLGKETKWDVNCESMFFKTVREWKSA